MIATTLGVSALINRGYHHSLCSGRGEPCTDLSRRGKKPDGRIRRAAHPGRAPHVACSVHAACSSRSSCCGHLGERWCATQPPGAAPRHVRPPPAQRARRATRGVRSPSSRARRVRHATSMAGECAGASPPPSPAVSEEEDSELEEDSDKDHHAGRRGRLKLAPRHFARMNAEIVAGFSVPYGGFFCALWPRARRHQLLADRTCLHENPNLKVVLETSSARKNVHQAKRRGIDDAAFRRRRTR